MFLGVKNAKNCCRQKITHIKNNMQWDFLGAELNF